MFTFQKAERLCGKKAIDELFAKGKSKTQFPLKLIYKVSEFETGFPVRAMFVVPKKKHKRANKRNVLKRRLREAYRLNKQTLYTKLVNTKYDIMFVYLSNEESDFESIQKIVVELLNKIS
jgi:ribonuclease P protein component